MYLQKKKNTKTKQNKCIERNKVRFYLFFLEILHKFALYILKKKIKSNLQEGIFKDDQVALHHSAELQKDEAPEIDYPELQHLVKRQRTKAEVAAGVTPQTSDDHSESELRTPAAGQASSSCLLSN